MRIAVTGASGHVGGAIARGLVALGHEVVALGRRSPGIEGLAGALTVDLADADVGDLAAATAPCGAIVHAAAAIDHDPHALSVSVVNGAGTQRLLDLAERWRSARFVYLSGVPVIGRPSRLPVTEDHPIDPPTAYHASKLYGEHLVSLAVRRGLLGATLRLTAPVGPAMPRGRILSVFVERALAGAPLELAGRGARAQDYVDVRDVADAVAACLERDVHGVFNVAAGRATTNADLARRCVAVLGSSSAVVLSGHPDPDDDVRWEVAIDRARAAFGYAPRHGIDDSIRAVAGR